NTPESTAAAPTPDLDESIKWEGYAASIDSLLAALGSIDLTTTTATSSSSSATNDHFQKLQDDVARWFQSSLASLAVPYENSTVERTKVHLIQLMLGVVGRTVSSADQDVLEVQIQSALELIESLGIFPSKVSKRQSKP
ncbi:hypothetical protein HDV05_001128, partial [Chytridiales sp. JEL 0842]